MSEGVLVTHTWGFMPLEPLPSQIPAQLRVAPFHYLSLANFIAIVDLEMITDLTRRKMVVYRFPGDRVVPFTFCIQAFVKSLSIGAFGAWNQ